MDVWARSSVWIERRSPITFLKEGGSKAKVKGSNALLRGRLQQS